MNLKCPLFPSDNEKKKPFAETVSGEESFTIL